MDFIHSSRQLPDTNRPLPRSLPLNEVPQLDDSIADDGWIPGAPWKKQYASLTNPHGHSGSAVRPPATATVRAPASASDGVAGSVDGAAHYSPPSPTDEPLWESRTSAKTVELHPLQATRGHRTANIPRPRSRIRKAGRLAARFLFEVEGNMELHGELKKKNENC